MNNTNADDGRLITVHRSPFTAFWRDGRAVEGGSLESYCSHCGPGVRIPLSPPVFATLAAWLRLGEPMSGAKTVTA